MTCVCCGITLFFFFPDEVERKLSSALGQKALPDVPKSLL